MPMHHGDDHPPQGPPSQTRLFELVTQYQQLLVWRDGTSDPVQQAEFNNELQAAGLELWDVLRQPLMRKVRRRVGGALRDMLNNPASYPTYRDAVESLAMNSMLGLLEALPSLTLNPDRNPQAYLTTIAWYGLLDEERSIYSGVQRGHRGTPILLLHLDQVLRALDDDEDDVTTTNLLKDERASQAMAHVIDRQLSHALSLFWRATLSEVDQRIVLLRLQEPVTPYEQIVVQLGNGWNAATVRQRFARAMRRTRIYLEEHEWI